MTGTNIKACKGIRGVERQKKKSEGLSLERPWRRKMKRKNRHRQNKEFSEILVSRGLFVMNTLSVNCQ